MSSETPQVTSEEFRRACGRFATGVSIATVTDAAGTPHGLTVSSFTSVSLEPPLALICLGKEVTNIQHFCNATYFGINILAKDQRGLSDRFARKGQDRFDGIGWHRGTYGVPLLPGCLAEIECRVYRRLEMGDHDIFVGELVRVHIGDGEPLIHFASKYRELKRL